MKYWTTNIWGANLHQPDEIAKQKKSLEQSDCDAIILFCQHEYNYSILLNKLDILAFAKSKNIKVYIIIGTDNDFHIDTNDENLEIICWPTYWFRETFLRYFVRPHKKDLDGHKKLIKNLNDLDYKYHYIYLNGKNRKWRCDLIDRIAKQDLLKYSAYSWQNESMDRSIMGNYKFKYFHGNTKKLDEDFSMRTQYYNGLIPKEYYQSFFQLVPETTIQMKFITEKTVLPLMAGKPFLVCGVQGIHQNLKNLGFELFDELFDYNFDNHETDSDRFDGICENIKNITKMSLDECKKFHHKIQDKINHNRQRAIELTLDENEVPKLVKDVVKIFEETGTNLDATILDNESDLKLIKDNFLLDKYICL